MGKTEDNNRLGKVQKELSRRGFVKGLALTGCAAAFTQVGGLTGCSPRESSDSEKEEGELSTAGYQYSNEQAGGEWHYNACPRNCFDTCAIMSKVVDGTLVEIKGNPDNTYTNGGLCVKTQSYIDWTYNADRILYPMKRTGQKGPGCTFERISWDEAIDTITTRWKEIIETDGAEAIAPNYFSGTMGFIQGDFWPACLALFRRMGATHLMPGKCSNSKAAGYSCALGGGQGVNPEMIGGTDLFIDWGENPTSTAPHFVKYIKELKRNGGKLAVVNPVRIPIVDWADMFIQINPATDAAFCLGVANEIISNGWADLEFIEKYTVGFDEYKASAAEWSLERTAETCGVTEQEIKDFAELYATAEKSILRSGVQPCRRLNGGMIMYSIALLPALIGHIGKQEADGFQIDTSYYWGLSQMDTSCVQFTEGAQPADANDPGTLKVRYYANAQIGNLLNGIDVPNQKFSDPLLKSIYIFNANTIVSDPDTNLIIKGLQREDLFTVVHEIQMTPTAEYADIILPAPTHFESEEISQAYGSLYVVHNEQTIAPLGEAKNNWEVACLLAKAMGYDDPEFDRTFEDLANILVNSTSENPAYNGLTYDKLKEMHQYKLDIGIPSSDYLKNGFPTPSGKVEFASDAMGGFHEFRTSVYTKDRESGDGDPELLKDYPLNFLTNAPKEYLNGTFGNMANNNLLFGTPLVYVHADDAAERGISEGDRVRIFNGRGELFRTAFVGDEYVQKGSVLAFKSTWDNYMDDGNVNYATLCDVTDMGFCTPYESALVQIEKA